MHACMQCSNLFYFYFFLSSWMIKKFCVYDSGKARPGLGIIGPCQLRPTPLRSLQKIWTSRRRVGLAHENVWVKNFSVLRAPLHFPSTLSAQRTKKHKNNHSHHTLIIVKIKKLFLLSLQTIIVLLITKVFVELLKNKKLIFNFFYNSNYNNQI